MTINKIRNILLVSLLVFAGTWFQSVVATETEVSGTCNIEESPGYLQCMASDGVTVFDRTLPPASIDCQRWHINDVENYLACSCDILESEYYIDECNKGRESLQPKYDAYKIDTEGLSSTSQCTLLLSDEYKNCFFGEYNTRDKCIWFQINQSEYVENCSCDLLEDENKRSACYSVRNESQDAVTASVSNSIVIDSASLILLNCPDGQNPASVGLCLYDLAKADGNNRAYCNQTEDEVVHYTCDRSISMKRPTIVDMTCQNDVSGPYTRDNCYLEKAQDTEDVRYCPNISNYARSVQCYDKFPKDVTVCNMEDEYLLTECIINLAHCSDYPTHTTQYDDRAGDVGQCYQAYFENGGLSQTSCQYLSFEYADTCLKEYIDNTKNYADCINIQDLKLMRSCLENGFRNRMSFSACDAIAEIDKRDNCYLVAANYYRTESWEVCGAIQDNALRDQCRYKEYIQLYYLDDVLVTEQKCREVDNQEYRENCLAMAAYDTGDVKLCAFHKDIFDRSMCWVLFGVFRGNHVVFDITLIILLLLIGGMIAGYFGRFIFKHLERANNSILQFIYYNRWVIISSLVYTALLASGMIVADGYKAYDSGLLLSVVSPIVGLVLLNLYLKSTYPTLPIWLRVLVSMIIVGVCTVTAFGFVFAATFRLL